jgi:hypothetical protein
VESSVFEAEALALEPSGLPRERSYAMLNEFPDDDIIRDAEKWFLKSRLGPCSIFRGRLRADASHAGGSS